MTFLFALLVIIIFIYIVFKSNFRKQDKRLSNSHSNTGNAILESGMSIKETIIDKISNDFSLMPDWDIWDKSIHQAPGQIDRLERAIKENIKVLVYDPKYRNAKVCGSTENIYLVSAKSCSCMDFRKRHLPCKHMYALAIELDGDIDKEIAK